MAWKDSNDLSPFTFVVALISLPLLFHRSCLNLQKLCVHTLFNCLIVSVGAGGRGVVVGPIVSQTLSDVFCDNEYGPNFLFRNNGDGTFTDVAQQAGKRNMDSLTDHSLESVNH